MARSEKSSGFDIKSSLGLSVLADYPSDEAELTPGKVTVIEVPIPILLSMAIRPSCKVTSDCTTESPRPEPAVLVVSGFVPRKNGVNIDA